MAIPFKSIRYEDGVTEWGINFSRLDSKIGRKIELDPPIPRQFAQPPSLALPETLVMGSPPPSPKTNFSLSLNVLGWNSVKTGKITSKDPVR